MRVVVLAALLVLLSAHNVGYAQSWQPPPDSQRCPSKWGPDDQRGSGNLMKPETVLRAARLIRTGGVIELGQVLSASMPFSNGRVFELHTKRTVMNAGSNRRGSNEEIVFSEIGQVESCGTRTMTVTAGPIRASASRAPSGWRGRTRCSSGPTSRRST